MRAPLIISILLLLFTDFVFADITIRYDAITAKHKKPLHNVLLKQDLIRYDDLSGHQPGIMLDLQSGDIIQLQSKTKSFFKINIQTINEYVSLYRQNKVLVQGLIYQWIKHMDPAKQGQIQKMLDNFEQKSISHKSTSLRKTGKFDQVLGVKCQILAIFNQGIRTSDVCLANYTQLKLPANDILSFGKLNKILTQLKQITPGDQDILTTMVSGLEYLNGVPLQVVQYYPDGKIKNMIRAGSVSVRQIPPLAFQIPKGFVEKKIPAL